MTSVVEKEGPAREPNPLASDVEGLEGGSTELRQTRVYRFTWLENVS